MFDFSGVIAPPEKNVNDFGSNYLGKYKAIQYTKWF
jgi:hypothetical protein